MSNSYIAAFRTQEGALIASQIVEDYPEWKVSINDPKFSHVADAHIIFSRSAMLLWVGSRSVNPVTFYNRLGVKLGCPWIVVSFLEHIVWEYRMFEGSELIDEFVPAPEVWELPQPKLGNLQILSKVWGVKTERIQRYLKHWNSALKVRRAYFWHDRFCYKRPEQGFDFLHAITRLRFPGC